jgi:hypothetical protein
VRFTLLCASAALAASLVLSACSGGAGSTGASAIPGSGSGVSSMGHHKIKMTAIAMHVNRRPACPSNVIACIALNYGSGPYTEWSACFSTYDCPPTYDIVASATFSKIRTGGSVGRGQIAASAYYPSPGNPTYQYIEPGRHYVAHARARFYDSTSAYLYYYPSSTAYGTFGIY